MLEKIHSHATIILGGDYAEFKSELEEKGISYLCFDFDDSDPKNKEVNLKMIDLSEMRDFQNSKSSNARYIVTDRSIRNTQVQNAMLKLLEEPSEGVHIVLFVSDLSMILPTVLSRCQLIDAFKSDDKSVINRIINNKNNKDRFLKLQRYLRIDNLHKRGLVSTGQLQHYKSLI